MRTVFFKSLRAPPGFLEPLFTCLLLCEVILSSIVKCVPITFHKSEALIITGMTVHVYLFTSLLSTSLHCDVSTVGAGLQPARAPLGPQHLPALGPQWALITICGMNVCEREALCPERAQNQLNSFPCHLSSLSLISSL